MKNNNIWLLLGLALLVAAAWYVYQQSNKRTLGDSIQQTFLLADTASISKIIITKRLGNSNTLTRTKNGWSINQKTEAAPAIVQQLLVTIHDLQVKRPCTRAEREVVIKEMATDNLKVEIYTGDGSPFIYFLGGPTDESQGNYALLDGSEEPVVLYLPNWQGYISPRFAIDSVEWRNKQLFRSSPQTLQSVSVSFPTNPTEDFTVNVDRTKGFSLASGDMMDTAKTAEFLTAFSRIYISEYLTEPRVADSINRQTPMAIVSVKDANPAYSHEVRLYPKPIKNQKDILNQDRILGYIPAQRQAVTLQPQNVYPLLTPKSSLIKR